ncbi:Altered inheritance of mitochondria protein 9, mitochondrial, partial [Leucoagaricus sp. SymC.cos]
ERAIRYTPFNPDGLARVACEAMGTKSCTRFEKVYEGSLWGLTSEISAGAFNKTFRLTLDDSMNVIARVPCPIAGPSYLVTASEVATRQFVKEAFDLPVPRVIAWSGARRDPASEVNVGTDYIIEEEAPGVPLSERWRTIPTSDEVKPSILGVLNAVEKFSSLRFSQIGSIFFKEDVSPELRDIPLLVGDVDQATLRLSKKYCIGPMMDPQWWRGDRAHTLLDHGPWPDPVSFFLAAAKNEQEVLSHYQQQDPSSNMYRRKPAHDLVTHFKLLTMYIRAVPHVLPTSNDDICSPTLWHPDLSLPNIFVPPSGPTNLQSIVDWQHTAVVPYFMCGTIPSAFVYDGMMINMDNWFPALPSNFEEMSAHQQAECRLELRLATRQRMYEGKTMLDPRRRLSDSLPYQPELALLPTYVSRAWADGIFDFREALVHLHNNWTTIVGRDTSCPIKFSAEEIKEHEEQLEAFRCYQEAVNTIDFGMGLGEDGWLPHERYDYARSQISNSEKSWDAQMTGSPFPYKDGEYSLGLS